MQVYAYKVILKLKKEVDTKTAEYESILKDNHEKICKKIEQFGVNPLPNEPLTTSMDEETGEVTITWRSLASPDRQDLEDMIKDHAKNWGSVESFEVYYHKCGNGANKPCGPWQILMTGGNK